MIDKKREEALIKGFFLTFFLWLIVTTWRIAPLNPPEWSNGIFYPIWWATVFWAVMIVSMLPSGFIVILSCKLFKLPKVVFCSFCFIWFFDYYMTKNYPMFAITPGAAFSALYVFVLLKQKGNIKF